MKLNECNRVNVSESQLLSFFRFILLVYDFGIFEFDMLKVNLLGLLPWPLRFEGDILLPAMKIFSFWYWGAEPASLIRSKELLFVWLGTTSMSSENESSSLLPIMLGWCWPAASCKILEPAYSMDCSIYEGCWPDTLAICACDWIDGYPDILS